MVGFDEQAERRAPAHRLQAQRAGTCKQVNYPRAINLGRPVGMGQHVEDGLARAIPRRACALTLRRSNRASLVLSGNDAHSTSNPFTLRPCKAIPSL